MNNKKIINAWCMFDWANSVYSLVITVAIFPSFYQAMTNKAFGGDLVNFLGFEINNSVLYSYSLSFSFLVLSALLPILSGIADFSGQKKPFMRFFTMLGAFSCMGLFWFTGENVVWGIGCSVLASIGFGGSIVFYNAYLPEIASPENYDSVSAKGFAYGYFGSVLLLILNLAMALFPAAFGFSETNVADALNIRVSFILVGLWWIGFSQITFYHLPNPQTITKEKVNLLVQGFLQLKAIVIEISQQTNTKRFLAAFFCYNAGVQTIIYLASLFASQELQLPQAKLIITILILQIVAIGGAAVFAKVSEAKGNKFAIMLILCVWIVDCVFGYFVQNEYQFYGLAAGVGIVMGGIQSLSRATYCKLFPENTTETASYFSLYDVLDKFSTFFGTLCYGIITQYLGGMRNSIFALSLFFVAGLVLMATVQIKKAAKSA
jgi:MFS transporter, UMF1 family